MKSDALKAWGAAVAAILPGDHIHAVAPIHRVDRFGQNGVSKMEQIEAAERKRRRKAEKRRAR